MSFTDDFIPNVNIIFLILDWKSVIQVGAIDCAQDVNMPTCREYEVSFQFFKSQDVKLYFLHHYEDLYLNLLCLVLEVCL